MAKKALKPAMIRESWRLDSASAQQLANRQRTVWLWFVTLVLILSFVTFGYLLFGPFFHPTLRLYYLTAGSYEAMDVRPIPFFQEDAVRFLSIDGSFHKEDATREFSMMDSPEAVGKYLQRVVETDFQKSDVALLQISAQPMLADNRPFLKCANFKGEATEAGAFSIEELLNQLDRMSVGLTLVCLNLGPSESQAIDDSMREDFLYRLRDLMKSRKNPSQWILLSNSPQEGSYVSLELQSSVFSYAITTALKGTADLNRDAAIDLDEFVRFVVGFTQSQVLRESGGNTQQTPILITTGVNSESNLSLIPIASTPSQGMSVSWWARLSSWWNADADEDDAKAQSDKVAKKTKEEKGWLTEYLDRTSSRIQEITMEEIEDNINFLPTALGEKVKKSIGMSEESEEVAKVESSPETESASEAAAEPTQVAAVADKQDSVINDQKSTVESTRPSASSIPDLTQLADPKSSNLELLQLAWQFCDYLEHPQDDSVRPVDVAPHAWNELITHLHGIEERLRTDSAVDLKTIRLLLTSEIVGAYQFSMTRQAKVGKLAKRISDQMPDLAVSNVSCTSIGLMERLAEYGGTRVPNSVATQAQQLDAAIGMDNAESFQKWSAQLPGDLSAQYVEFFWSQQFAARPSVPWKITRRVIGLWRQYQRLAHDPMSSNRDVQQSLVTSQRSLLEATRLALDQIGSDWTDRSRATLDKADLALMNATEKRNQLRDAYRLRNQTLADLPAILKWRKVASSRLGSTLLDKDIEQTIDVLSKLCVQLQDRENCELTEVVRNYDSLKAVTGRVYGYWVDEANGLIAGSVAGSRSVNWIVDSLLATPFIRSPIRNRLLSLPVARELPAAAEIDLDSQIPRLSSTRSITQESQLQLRFESLAASIAGMQYDYTTTEAKQLTADVEKFHQDVAHQISHWSNIADTNSSDLLSPTNGAVSQLQELRRLDLALRQLPTLETQLLDGKSIGSRLWQLEMLQCVMQEQKVSQKCIQDALPQEAPFWNYVSERLGFLASTLSQTQQPTNRLNPALTIRGTSSISLVTETQGSGEVVLQNVGNPVNMAWVLLDYDPKLIEIDGPTGIQLHQVATIPAKAEAARYQAEQKLLLAIAAGAENPEAAKTIDECRRRIESLSGDLVYPIHPEASLIAPTMGLTAGQVVSIPFKVRRIGSGASQTKLVWKLVGDNDYVRHEVIIQLPEAENMKLVIDGATNSWSTTTEGVELFLWPNRPTDYRFGLRNESAQPRVLAAELVALSSRREVTLPDGFLNSSDSIEVSDALGPMKLIASLPEVTVTSKSEPVWLELLPLGGVDAQAPATGSAPAPAQKEPAPIPTDYGLVLILTDKTTSQKFWRRIETRVRHPRSYIEPSVRFDAVSERAEIRLNARALDMVPAKGIAVVGRIVEQLPRGTEMKTEGSILPGETMSLYCQVPNVGARELTFEVDIDGFPRAFVIKVPCWRTNLDIPVASDFQRIEFTEPFQSLSVGPNEKTQKLRLKIDAIPGAFETKRDYVEVGWDLDRDREFANETTFKFAAERQVDASINSILSGRVSMTARVKDISLELPLPTVKNQRVNLLARLFSGGEMIWSQPVEVTQDFDPPVITGVEILPGTTLQQGTDLQIRAGVDDAELSGIASVEVKIDSKGVGKFSDSTAPAQACVRESDSSWTLKAPTSDLMLGRATLFVRATDRVGNVSEDSKTLLTILSEQEWKDQLQNATHELTGTVLYADEPLRNAKVTITNDKSVVVFKSTTDDRGAFRVPSIQAGKYKVVAVGVMKNRPRIAEQEVEVVGPQAPPIRLRLIAK